MVLLQKHIILDNIIIVILNIIEKAAGAATLQNETKTVLNKFNDYYINKFQL